MIRPRLSKSWLIDGITCCSWALSGCRINRSSRYTIKRHPTCLRKPTTGFISFFVKAAAASSLSLAREPKFSPNSMGADSLKSLSLSNSLRQGLICINSEFLRAAVLCEFAFPNSRSDVWMGPITSTGSSSSSTFSST